MKKLLNIGDTKRRSYQTSELPEGGFLRHLVDQPSGRSAAWALRILVALLYVPVAVWAGSDMSSTNYKIRRSDMNSGGSHKGVSASYKLTSSAGTGGGSLFSG